MPRYDRLIRVSQPAVQTTLGSPYGYGNAVWLPGTKEGKPQYKTSGQLTQDILAQHGEVDDFGFARNLVIPYRLGAYGISNYELVGGWPVGDKIFNADGVAGWDGLLIGSPVNSQRLPLVPARSDGEVIGTLDFELYSSATQSKAFQLLQSRQRLCVFRLGSISAFQFGLFDVRFADPPIDLDIGITDFRQGEIGPNATPFYGFNLDYHLAYTAGALKLWARQTDSRDSDVPIFGTAQSEVSQRRDWQIRWRPKSTIDVRSLVTDADGVWTVIERIEGDSRRRALTIVGEQKQVPDDG